MHAMPGCASRCQGYAGVYCKEPDFFTGKPSQPIAGCTDGVMYTSTRQTMETWYDVGEDYVRKAADWIAMTPIAAQTIWALTVMNEPAIGQVFTDEIKWFYQGALKYSAFGVGGGRIAPALSFVGSSFTDSAAAAYVADQLSSGAFPPNTVADYHHYYNWMGWYEPPALQVLVCNASIREDWLDYPEAGIDTVVGEWSVAVNYNMNLNNMSSAYDVAFMTQFFANQVSYYLSVKGVSGLYYWNFKMGSGWDPQPTATQPGGGYVPGAASGRSLPTYGLTSWSFLDLVLAGIARPPAELGLRARCECPICGSHPPSVPPPSPPAQPSPPAAPPAPPAGTWVDESTPAESRTAVSEMDGLSHAIAFSDEFNIPGRTFNDGDDSRWAALRTMPYSNEQLNFYSPGMALTSASGVLEIRVDAKRTPLPVANPSSRLGFDLHEATFRSAMLQSWDKFCFSGGIVEARARMPGSASMLGLWPAFWMMGNLGRAAYKASTDGLWPFLFDECVGEDAADCATTGTCDCAASQCDKQRITACAAHPPHGLNSRQGRGAPEIDVLEVQPGGATFSYDKQHTATKGCPGPLDPKVADALNFEQPFASTSLQVAPGVRYDADQRPTKECAPTTYVQPAAWGGKRVMQWYPALSDMAHYGSNVSTAYRVTANYYFWGDDFKHVSFPRMDGTTHHADDFQTDALSANTKLDQSFFDSYHTYRVEWRPGAHGFIRWSLDGKLQFQIDAAVLATPFNISVNGSALGKLRPRHLPTEPMYLIFNLDISQRWGWPDCTEVTGCSCCTDCANPDCYQCTERQWLKDTCAALDSQVSYSIDWVRVFTPKGAAPPQCSPSSHPTRQWIGAHATDYMQPADKAPLRKVVAGGGGCSLHLNAKDDFAMHRDCNWPHGRCDRLQNQTRSLTPYGLCVCDG